jgi:hypothetical protein
MIKTKFGIHNEKKSEDNILNIYVNFIGGNNEIIDIDYYSPETKNIQIDEQYQFYEIKYKDSNFIKSDFISSIKLKNKCTGEWDINISDEEPCGISFCFFVFCCLLLLGELYKCYFNSFCIDQEFKIRKLISTRYDLNVDQYKSFIPSIDVLSQKYVFEEQNYNYINNKFHVIPPTSQEIKNAEIYKDKIPQYKCSTYTSFQGEIKIGVVQDDPGYCSAIYNEEPPPYSCDAPNAKEQNNINNNMNPNYNVNVQNNNDIESNDESKND